MDEAALERVQLRLSAGPSDDRPSARFEAALERSREQIEALEAATAALQTAIPTQVGEAVRDGLRAETLPVARHIAELRGLFNQANRRLARIEAEVLAERKARIDDLALLVDLVSAGWRGVDARLERLEAGGGVASNDDVTSNDRVENGAPEHLPSPREESDALAERAAA